MALLEIEHLTEFFGGLRAVSDFNIRLEHGEIVGLIGPNGAGKTTVFNVITGVYRPTQGTIVFDGQSIVGKKTHQITQLGIARTFQTIRLFTQSSVIDNIKIAYHFRMPYGNMDSFLHTRKYWEGERMVDDYAIDLLRIFIWTSRQTTCPVRCPTAPSAASKSPVRWRPTRASCCSTNRSARSTR